VLCATHAPGIRFHIHRSAARSEMIELPKSGESFVDCWSSPLGHPPKCLIGTLERLKEFAAAGHDRCMRAAINEGEERLGAFPNRHVHREERIRGRANAGRVATLVLQTPHETGTCVRQRIDAVQSREEVRGARIALRRVSRPQTSKGYPSEATNDRFSTS
jgi:hypothetical protein